MSSPKLCPRCGRGDSVAAIEWRKEQHHHCGSCELVFDGSPDEWDQWTNRRSVVVAANLAKAGADTGCQPDGDRVS